MSNSVEQLAYNPDLVVDHMRAITRIEENQLFIKPRPELVSDDPILYQAGILAVRGCMQVCEGEQRKAVAVFDEARDVLQGILEQEQSLPRRIPYEQLDGSLSLYRTWAQPFIWKSRREQRVLEARASLYDRTIESLGRLAILPRDRKQHTSGGYRTELATIALLERQMHPWVLSTSALPHHDKGAQKRGRKNRNFDVLTTESMPVHETTYFRLQCKGDCLGVCQEFYKTMLFEAYEARSRARNNIRGADDNIKEISGCCDLDLWNTEKIQTAKDPIALLVKESRGEASAEEVAELDALSSSLTLTASLPGRIKRHDSNFPLSPLAKKDLERQKQEASFRLASKARRLQAEERREAARAGIARVMSAGTKAS